MHTGAWRFDQRVFSEGKIARVREPRLHCPFVSSLPPRISPLYLFLTPPLLIPSSPKSLTARRFPVLSFLF